MLSTSQGISRKRHELQQSIDASVALLKALKKELNNYENTKATIEKANSNDEVLRGVMLESLESATQQQLSKQEATELQLKKYHHELQQLIENERIIEEERKQREREAMERELLERERERLEQKRLELERKEKERLFKEQLSQAQGKQNNTKPPKDATQGTPKPTTLNTSPFPSSSPSTISIPSTAVSNELFKMDREWLINNAKEISQRSSIRAFQLQDLEEESKKLEALMTKDTDEEQLFQLVSKLENLYQEISQIRLDKLKYTAMARLVEITELSDMMQEIVPIKVQKYITQKKRIHDKAKELNIKTNLLNSQYSTTALVLEGREQKVKLYCQWLEDEDLLEIESKKGKYTHVFVDFSNVFIGAFHVADPSQKSATRINVPKLVSKFQGSENPLGTLYVVGSSTSMVQKNTMEKKWRKEGFKTKFQVRNKKEQLVDDALIAEINAVQLRKFDQVQHIILVTGDGNLVDDKTSFPSALESALKLGWTAEVWSWKASLNMEYKRLQRQYPQLLIVELDAFKDQIIFYEKKWEKKY
eukprot:TRINITY_DN19209_c0_g1_i1.p1 TRINITY_DN19209_c0_g1~~TRINITY_DN19209_c0_g1_i1.p1  ORF type:complete len:535 (+),score=129.09 TRINITY_DN19209_c0_g1_i1:120-1724(+)